MIKLTLTPDQVRQVFEAHIENLRKASTPQNSHGPVDIENWITAQGDKVFSPVSCAFALNVSESAARSVFNSMRRRGKITVMSRGRWVNLREG